MLRLLQWLFVGHVHRWKILENRSLANGSGSTGSRYILQCEACGDVCKRDLI